MSNSNSLLSKLVVIKVWPFICFYKNVAFNQEILLNTYSEKFPLHIPVSQPLEGSLATLVGNPSIEF